MKRGQANSTAFASVCRRRSPTHRRTGGNPLGSRLFSSPTEIARSASRALRSLYAISRPWPALGRDRAWLAGGIGAVGVARETIAGARRAGPEAEPARPAFLRPTGPRFRDRPTSARPSRRASRAENRDRSAHRPAGRATSSRSNPAGPARARCLAINSATAPRRSSCAVLVVRIAIFQNLLAFGR